MEAARAKAAVMGEAGVRAELLDNTGLRLLEPNLAPDLAGGVFFPDDAQIDPRRATLAFIEAARRHGLSLHAGAGVTDIQQAPDGRVSGVVTEKVEIATENVVCAAGAWSNEVTRQVGIDLPVRPRKGHVLVASKSPGLIHHPLLEGGYVSTVQTVAEGLQVAFAAELTASGTLLLGSSREFAGYDRTVSLDVIRAVAGRAVRFLPSLAGKGIIRSYAGLRPWSPDHLPVIGPVAGAPGFYVATGHEGAGICLAPITGQLIAGWITGNNEMPACGQAARPDRLL
jgi:glycine/D-amino acid oxidase-like deaminating enzyme